ncbi:hypothetical protein PM082_006537 [Marasmius tenuissimus]|nr:hypothetical protein PM082_006537 [Marasmius tenuissimus]
MYPTHAFLHYFRIPPPENLVDQVGRSSSFNSPGAGALFLWPTTSRTTEAVPSEEFHRWDDVVLLIPQQEGADVLRELRSKDMPFLRNLYIESDYLSSSDHSSQTQAVPEINTLVASSLRHLSIKGSYVLASSFIPRLALSSRLVELTIQQPYF